MVREEAFSLACIAGGRDGCINQSAVNTAYSSTEFLFDRGFQMCLVLKLKGSWLGSGHTCTDLIIAAIYLSTFCKDIR